MRGESEKVSEKLGSLLDSSPPKSAHRTLGGKLPVHAHV